MACWVCKNSTEPTESAWSRVLRLALQPLVGQIVEIFLPILRMIPPELEKIIPAVDPGRMQIVEHQTHGIVADWMQFENSHIFFAGDSLALIRRMPLHLGTGTLHAQVFGSQVEALAVLECDGQYFAALVQAQFRRPRLRRAGVH